jgi:hypothetical protein
MQQPFGIAVAGAVANVADARGDTQRRLFDGEAERDAQPVDDVVDLGGVVFDADVAHDHREFVAVQPGDEVDGAHGRRQAAGRRAQDVIARPVAQRVVHGFEPVEIDEHDAEALGFADHRVQTAGELHAVGAVR